jgi:hypothetical protein
MGLGYFIPRPKKYIHQGPTVQDTKPIPILDRFTSIFDNYLPLDSLRYRSPAFIYRHNVSNVVETHPTPIVDRFTSIFDNYLALDSLRYLSPAIIYRHQGSTVQATNPIPKLPISYFDTFYAIPKSSKLIDVASAPVIVSSDVFRKAQPDSSYYIYNPISRILSYVHQGATSQDTRPIPIPDRFLPIYSNYIPLDFERYTRQVKKITDLGLLRQQTYIFPVKQPIQEYWTNLIWNKFFIAPKPFLDNIFSIGNVLLACVNLTETWQAHFASRGWLTIQDQVSAGYPIYCEPALLTGSYENIIDFGQIYPSTIVNISYSTKQVSGSSTIAVKIATSTDGITYTAFTSSSSVFGTSVRYAKFHFDVTGSDDKSLIEIYNIHIILDVRRDLDSGTVIANAGDVGGTTVTMSKAFKSLDSITLAALGTTQINPVYDFNFATINPTTFKVYAFDNAGVRVSASISWKARGII